jgi:hypothetical protein
MSSEKVKLDDAQTYRCRVALTRLAQVLQLDITTATDNELMVTVAELAESLRSVLGVLEDVAEVPR